jgi:hypothetical protein
VFANNFNVVKVYRFKSSESLSTRVSEPNFDDERTLLTARRVVPLEKIKARVRHRRRWFLGSAFALAMLLGAASALLASYLRLRNEPSTVSEISEVETPATPLAVVEPLASALPATENAEIPEESAAPETPHKPRTIARPKSTVTRPRVVIRPASEQDELNHIREAVLFDAWQERRARRALRRERRNRVDHHDRDLSNLDEIFEGPRRKP